MPEKKPDKTKPKYAVIFFAVLVIVSSAYAYLKYKALAYDTIDYPFYAQFSARLFNNNLSNTFSAQPEGFNMLGYVGIEGKYSFHQSLHLEPIKYIFALFFAFLPYPITLFTLFSLIYFSPFLYLAFLQKKKPFQNYSFPFLILTIYALYPSAINTVTYDLRPRILLSTFFVLAFFAVLYQRPLPEKFILLFFIALAREEALLFIAALIAMNYFMLSDKRQAVKETLVFTLVWFFYAFVIFTYFDWTGYEMDHILNPIQKTLGNPTFLITLTLLFLFWSILWKKTQQKRIPLRKLISIAAFSSILLPLGIQLHQEINKWMFAEEGLVLTAITRILFSPKMNIYIVVLLLLSLLVWKVLGQPQFSINSKRIGYTALLTLLATSLYKATTTSIDYWQSEQEASIVFDLLEDSSPYTTHILVDESTYQAFFQFENLTLYERLPWSVGQESRYYPDNIFLLQETLQNIDYIAISQKSAEIIYPLLKDNGLDYQLLDQNSTYLILKTN